MGGHSSRQALYEAIAKDPDHHEKQIKELFKRYDADANGYVDGEEIGKFVKELLEYLQKHNNDEDPDIDLFELNQANKLSQKAFEAILKRYLRDAQPRPEPKRKPAKQKELQDMIDSLVGVWEGTPAKPDTQELPDSLSVTPLPQNTLHIIKDFMLCTHDNLIETLVIKKPIPWTEESEKGEFVSTTLTM